MSDNVEQLRGLPDMSKSTFQLDLLIRLEFHFSLIIVYCTDPLCPLISPLGGILSCPSN